jgi:hypothetical protein
MQEFDTLYACPQYANPQPTADAYTFPMGTHGQHMQDFNTYPSYEEVFHARHNFTHFPSQFSSSQLQAWVTSATHHTHSASQSYYVPPPEWTPPYGATLKDIVNHFKPGHLVNPVNKKKHNKTSSHSHTIIDPSTGRHGSRSMPDKPSFDMHASPQSNKAGDKTAAEIDKESGLFGTCEQCEFAQQSNAIFQALLEHLTQFTNIGEQEHTDSNDTDTPQAPLHTKCQNMQATANQEANNITASSHIHTLNTLNVQSSHIHMLNTLNVQSSCSQTSVDTTPATKPTFKRPNTKLTKKLRLLEQAIPQMGLFSKVACTQYNSGEDIFEAIRDIDDDIQAQHHTAKQLCVVCTNDPERDIKASGGNKATIV